MGLADRITTLWYSLCERSPAAKRHRERLGAAGGLAFLTAGFLAAVGLGGLVEIVLGAAAVVLALAAAIVAAPHARQALSASFRTGWIHEVTVRGSGALRVVTKASGAAYARSRSATRRAVRIGMSPGALRSSVGARRSPYVADVSVDLRGEALRLNTAGVRLRRDGSTTEAAAHHRAALTILRELGDDRSVALTLNNLALALSRDGDDAVAVGLFQRAAAILAELGDVQHEGEVIANLGLAHRRHGRGEEADNVLQLALRKLAPASNAYRTVEAELRRAS
jgi:tetratricopeptide (TPR) repeat protein